MGDRPLAMAFGSVAETYDRVRPPYFQPLVDRAKEVLGLGPDACVLDLGAGSGRLTRELVTRFRTVFAVEPDDDMRVLLDVGTVISGTAEQIPLADASLDAVFSARRSTGSTPPERSPRSHVSCGRTAH